MKNWHILTVTRNSSSWRKTVKNIFHEQKSIHGKTFQTKHTTNTTTDPR